MNECRRFRVEGRVQGVWFRESTRRKARLYGITGYAKNCPDGSVEVVACGSAGAISAIRDWLKKGPGMAQVTRVEEWPASGPCTDDFLTG